MDCDRKKQGRYREDNRDWLNHRAVDKYHANLDRSREQGRKWMRAHRETHPQDPEKHARYQRRYLKNHPEVRTAMAEANKRWQKANPERWKAICLNAQHRRRDRMNGNGCTLEQWQTILDVFRGQCAYCDISGNLHMDHFFPLAKGGAHDYTNIVPACRSCNSKKHARDPREFVADEGRYEAILTMMGDAEYAS